MIEFKRVKIHNFMAIGVAEIQLDNQGLVLIEGVNEDSGSAASNGAGKSSIVDAISWALYGITARGDTGDAIVNAKAGSECMVSVEVIVDGEEHVITRSRKHKVLKNRLQVRKMTPGGLYDDLTLGTDKLTQVLVERLLGCDAMTFNAAVYMGQERMPDLPAMTDKALKAILESALAIDRLDEALDIAKERLASRESTLECVKSRANNATAKVAELNDAADVMKDEIKAAKDQHAVGTERIAVMLQDADHQHQRAVDRLTEVREKIAALGAPEPVKLDRSKLDDLERRRAAVSSKLGECKTELQRARQHHRALMDGSSCSCCGRPMDNVKQEDIEAAAANIELRTSNLERVTDAAKKIQEAVNAEQAVLEDHRAKAQEARSEYDHLRQLEAQAVSGEEEAAARCDKMTKYGEQLMKDLSERVQYKMNKLDEIEDERERTWKTAATYAAQVPGHERDVEVAGRVVHALSRKGFRGELMDQVTPYLNARTKYYLDWLTGGEIDAIWNTITTNSDGDYVERFHIDVEAKSGVKRFSSLSGGEKRKVRLATAMALQDLVGTRAIKPIKLFVADEIDDAIDGAGLELLMSLLEEKAKDVGTMFLISHNDLADYAKQRLIVKKSGGQSTVSAP